MATNNTHTTALRGLLPAGCLALLLGTAACGDYTDELSSVGRRVELIEADTSVLHQQDATISALRALTQAIELNDYVTDVTENADGSFTITFKNKGPVVIYPGAKGQAGATHTFGVARDSDGLYYWTIDGEWLLDSSGHKVRISGKDGKDGEAADVNFPTLIIDDGLWKLWNTETEQWEILGQANGRDGKTDAIIDVVRTQDGRLIITTENGSVFIFSIL